MANGKEKKKVQKLRRKPMLTKICSFFRQVILISAFCNWRNKSRTFLSSTLYRQCRAKMLQGLLDQLGRFVTQHSNISGLPSLCRRQWFWWGMLQKKGPLQAQWCFLIWLIPYYFWKGKSCQKHDCYDL